MALRCSTTRHRRTQADEGDAGSRHHVDPEGDLTVVDADDERLVAALGVVGERGVDEAEPGRLLGHVDDAARREHPQAGLARQQRHGGPDDERRVAGVDLDAGSPVRGPLLESLPGPLEGRCPRPDDSAERFVTEPGRWLVAGRARRGGRDPLGPVLLDAAGRRAPDRDHGRTLRPGDPFTSTGG